MGIEVIDKKIRQAWQRVEEILKKRREAAAVFAQDKEVGSTTGRFAPYACHCADDMLITHSGDMLQIIRIDFRGIKKGLPDNLVLRERIRKSMASIANGHDRDVAFCLHTVRKGADVVDTCEYRSKFADSINRAWCSEIKLTQEFYTVVYISIVVSGLREKLSPAHFWKYAIFHFVRSRYMRHVRAAQQKLSKISAAIIEDMKDFYPVKLKAQKRGGVYYSDIVNAFTGMLRLNDRDVPLYDRDLKLYFNGPSISFGYNAFEIKTDTKKIFGCMMAFKELADVSGEMLDKLLSKNYEMVISETIEFTTKTKNIAKEVDYQQYLLGLGRASSLAKDIGLASFFSGLRVKNLMARRHATIMLTGDSAAALDMSAQEVNNAFSGAGYMMYRHDLGMEQAYWSQLPGNFALIPHKRFVSANNIANMFHIKSSQDMGDEYWGMPATYLLDQMGAQTRVSLHRRSSGHTLIAGHNARCKIFAHFILSQMQKFNPTTIYIDVSVKEDGKFFSKLLCGSCADSGHNQANAKVLCDFFSALDHKNKSANVDQWVSWIWDQKEALKDMAEQTSLSDKRDIDDAVVNNCLHLKVGSTDADSLFLDGFLDVLKLVKHDCQNPMIIFFNKPWRLIASRYLGNLDSFLNMIGKMGGIVVFLLDEMNEASCAAWAKRISLLAKTHVFFPTIHAKERYENLGADSYITDWLKVVGRKDGEALILKKEENVMAFEFKCRDIKLFSLLAPDAEVIGIIDGCFAKYGHDVNSWFDKLDFSS